MYIFILEMKVTAVQYKIQFILGLKVLVRSKKKIKKFKKKARIILCECIFFTLFYITTFYRKYIFHRKNYIKCTTQNTWIPVWLLSVHTFLRYSGIKAKIHPSTAVVFDLARTCVWMLTFKTTEQCFFWNHPGSDPDLARSSWRGLLLIIVI